MNKIISTLKLLFACPPVLMANADHTYGNDPGKGTQLDPATGKTFDFRKMVMSLLGLQEGCDEGAMRNAFNTAMAFEPTGEDKAIKNKLSEATIKANEVERKLGETTVLLANETGERKRLIAEGVSLLKRAELAEAAFANERNEHISTLVREAVVLGKLTKAEGEVKTKELANAKSPEEYDKAVKAIANSKTNLSTSSITLNLERTIAPGTASHNYTEKVKALCNEDKSNRVDKWAFHWGAFGKTQEGKAMLASMRNPQTNPLLQKA